MKKEIKGIFYQDNQAIFEITEDLKFARLAFFRAHQNGWTKLDEQADFPAPNLDHLARVKVFAVDKSKFEKRQLQPSKPAGYYQVGGLVLELIDANYLSTGAVYTLRDENGAEIEIKLPVKFSFSDMGFESLIKITSMGYEIENFHK
jgi:hypothetical protein